MEGNKEKGFEPMATDLYIPATINNVTISTKINIIPDNEDVTISWDAAQSGNKMMVDVDEVMNPKRLETYNKTQYVRYIEDNGHFTIPRSVLNKFKKEGGIQISIYRYNTNIKQVGSKKIALIAYNEHYLGTFHF